MTKLIKDLKKENVSLKSKCEEQHFSIAKLLSEVSFYFLLTTLIARK